MDCSEQSIELPINNNGHISAPGAWAVDIRAVFDMDLRRLTLDQLINSSPSGLMRYKSFAAEGSSAPLIP
jgi:hypothetical protein